MLKSLLMVAFVAAIFFATYKNAGLEADNLRLTEIANNNAAALVAALDERDGALRGLAAAYDKRLEVVRSYEDFSRGAGGCVNERVGADVASWVYSQRPRDGPQR